MPYKDPETRRAAKRETARRRRAGKAPCRPRSSPLPELVELRFRTARDVVRLLNVEVEAVRDSVDLEVTNRARTVGYLAGLLLRAIETGDLEERVAALEARFTGGGSGGGKEDGETLSATH